jgi:hypothetical protein
MNRLQLLKRGGCRIPAFALSLSSSVIPRKRLATAPSGICYIIIIMNDETDDMARANVL